jgi:hypothetical protein
MRVSPNSRCSHLTSPCVRRVLLNTTVASKAVTFKSSLVKTGQFVAMLKWTYTHVSTVISRACYRLP